MDSSSILSRHNAAWSRIRVVGLTSSLILPWRGVAQWRGEREKNIEALDAHVRDVAVLEARREPQSVRRHPMLPLLCLLCRAAPLPLAPHGLSSDSVSIHPDWSIPFKLVLVLALVPVRVRVGVVRIRVLE